MLVFADAAPGVRVELQVPDGAKPDAESALPAFELGPLRGAEITLRAGWSGPFGMVHVACATAPASGFAPGVEDLVFARATQIARTAIPGVSRLDASPVHPTRTGFDQRLEGEATLDGVATTLLVHHHLAFTDGGANAVLCSAACVERTTTACSNPIASFALRGDLSPPPPPGLATRAIFAAIEHPIASLALALSAFAVASWWIIARRPRAPQH